MNARETALKILYDIYKKQAYSNIALNKALKNNSFTRLDKNFISELVYGTLENNIYLDYVIEQFSNIKLNKIDDYTLNLLRLGLYQILFLERVPHFAVVNETVNLSKKYAKRSSGFVNGLLRNVLRNKNNILMPDKEKEIIKYLSVVYSHPEWMVKLFTDCFEKDFTESLLKSNNERPQMTLRVNTLKISAEECLYFLKEKGIEAEQSNYIQEAIAVNSGTIFEDFDLFDKGYIYIQDFGSMLSARIMDPKPGDFVIDVCSAPGGKATHLSQLMDNKGRIIARDIHEHKLKLVEENAERLGAKNIRTEKFNAEELDKRLIHKADKVLIDAPCSGLGIIRRKPEIKYRKTPQDIKAISEMQLRILKNASEYVKPSGELLYSTCTIIPHENSHVVERFLKENKDFKTVDINEEYNNIIPGTHKEKTVQLFPNIHKTDGFFIAKMKRI